MKTPKYHARNAITKTGVNYVRSVIEASNSIFTEIHQENDIGIDAIIEFIKDESPTGKCIGVQIKSGNSFYEEKTDECIIPVGKHADYWFTYALPVFGLVYVPAKGAAYWVDIKSQIRYDRSASSIRFRCTKANILNLDSFKRIFLPEITGTLPDEFLFDEALGLLHSPIADESNLGLYLLFRLHSDKNIVWDEFIKYFRERPSTEIPGIFAYYLAHIPWHGDISGGRDKITRESREYARALIHSLDRSDVVKLLSLIDDEGIARGTIGQSVEAIISSIPNAKEYLEMIIGDENSPIEIRESASLIYVYNNQGTARQLQTNIAILERIAGESEYARLLSNHLKEHGWVALY